MLNGEHFAVMAGIGFDGAMIKDADRKLKDRLGRLAYVWTGLRHVDGAPAKAKVKMDGVNWFDDEASCVLVGNVGTITGGIEAFDDASPTTAGWTSAWPPRRAPAVGAGARHDGGGPLRHSPFVRMTRARDRRQAQGRCVRAGRRRPRR